MNPYQALKAEIEDALTEMRFTSNILQIEWKHSIGEIIRRYSQDKSITPLLTQLAIDVGTSERSLWRCVKVYDLAPEEGGAQKIIESHGKNISVSKLLSQPDEEHEHTFQRVWFDVCSCGYKKKVD